MSTGPSASSARMGKSPAREVDVLVEEEHKNPTPGSYATRSTRAPRASSGIRTPLVDKAAESTNLVTETRTWLKNVPRALRYVQFVKMYHELQEENGEWEVQQILDARIRNRNLQYKIKWEGGDSDNAWYSAGDI
ncbi:hypothetical protein N7452_000846 [Penicillium brevicompactum]|uniref:Chromo domain-containing protein n=1 Tax=Penicillium brevicompactum TaxID=5074 RepID=A0A9W9R179_PENBR|nr:hypothetical protein N7452_000846 [Penicillium brevicompactum]